MLNEGSVIILIVLSKSSLKKDRRELLIVEEIKSQILFWNVKSNFNHNSLV